MSAEVLLAATSTGEAITFWVLGPLAAIAEPTEIGANTQNRIRSAATQPSCVPGVVPSGSGGSSSCSFV